LPAPIAHDDQFSILAQCIAALLRYVKSNGAHSDIFEQIENVIGLAHQCEQSNPVAAASVFGPLDKLLKRRGRKYDVLRLAELTIRAARSLNPPTQQLRQAEAKALICGRSWTYQRMNQLERAALYAEESNDCGEAIGYDRNTAFCKKCLGRLHRVQAEQVTGKERRAFLKQSVELLEEAIERFEKLEGFGPDHEEVGDCYSLLGRTNLASADVMAADRCAERARQLLTDLNSKDYLDLLILEGDILATKLDHMAADQRYTEAAQAAGGDDAEKSEIAARALLRRGLNGEKANRSSEQVESDLATAREIWEDCGDHYWAACAELERQQRFEAIPRELRRRVKKLTPTVAVHLIRRWRQASSQQSSRTLAQRNELTEIAWRKLVKQAKEDDALRSRHWGEVFG